MTHQNASQEPGVGYTPGYSSTRDGLFLSTRDGLFLLSGMIFLVAALALLGVGAWILYKFSSSGAFVAIIDMYRQSSSQSLEGDSPYNLFATYLSPLITPSILLTIASIICIMTGIRLLRAAGVTTKEVIPQRDYAILGPAIQNGQEKAVSEYIRLSSLSGITGAFTKIGLTGLPLATIFLTVLLSVLGIFVPAFLDLAKLTLGAFIGSYVQKERSA